MTLIGVSNIYWERDVISIYFLFNYFFLVLLLMFIDPMKFKSF